MNKVLILTDGRMGHLNQSIAFVKYMNLSYDIGEIKFKNRYYKGISYIFDFFGLKSKMLFDVNTVQEYKIIIGSGSTTYYAAKVLAAKMHAKSVTMMLPEGYRYDFDIIFAQSHDTPPLQENIIEIPANFSYVEPKGIYKAKKKSIGIVIGGTNRICTMSIKDLKEQLDFLNAYYKGYEIAITTSPRSSKEVEKLVSSYHFDYEVIFSQNPINPIPDFLEQCETVCITGDSTSMISEAVSYGKVNVIVLPLERKYDNKFRRFSSYLEKEGYVHILDGTIKHRNKKIDFARYAKQVKL